MPTRAQGDFTAARYADKKGGGESILRKISARQRKPAAHISGRFEPGKKIGFIQKGPARFADAA
jgi:hypothetical protein